MTRLRQISEPMRPPGRWRASNSMTRTPWSARVQAAVKPAIPPPTMTTFMENLIVPPLHLGTSSFLEKAQGVRPRALSLQDLCPHSLCSRPALQDSRLFQPCRRHIEHRIWMLRHNPQKNSCAPLGPPAPLFPIA